MPEASAADLRSLPSVDELLRSDAGTRFVTAEGHSAAVGAAREIVNKLRTDTVRGQGEVAERGSLLRFAVQALDKALEKRSRTGIRQVINATGIVVHTNLGRAPLPQAVVDAVQNSAGYATLEYDLVTGRRGRRGARAEALAAELTGAEDAVVVNNGAAAAYITLAALASGSEVVISRGELVEIGGDFRVPDVLAASGASLKEVGTTNRTKLADYQLAVTPHTRMILRVHPSNFRIVGFTAAPSRSELAALAHEKGLIFYEDLGSGALVDLSRAGLDEPVVRDAIQQGADIVSFSGDKLLGGPQAGIIAGQSDLIDCIRRHPLYRVLRCDKLILAALESSLVLYSRGCAEEEVPVLKEIFMTANEISARARELARQIDELSAIKIEIVDGVSGCRGGAAPGAELPTKLLSLKHETHTVERLEEMLRCGEPPVIARIEGGRLLLDLRTVSPEDEPSLVAAIRGLD